MTRKIGVLLLCPLVLSACSLSLEEILLIPTATPTFTPTDYLSPTITPSYTPTLPTPTHSLTPTLIGAKSPTPTSTPVPSSTEGPSPTALPASTATATFQMEGFTAIYLSNSVFYRGGNCTPSEVTFTAQAADATRTAFVQLFVRFMSPRTGGTGEWTSITMEKLGAGTFTYTLSADEIKDDDKFQNPWVQYQLVATDSNTRQIGRTQKFEEMLALKECSPTSTPTP